jgi:hypothetical protein
MPSSTPKQARVMSAIAHGWHPTGAAANIPVSVAKEYHALDAGKKWGGKHKNTAGPKVAAKYKAQYHKSRGEHYHAHGGGMTGGVMGTAGSHKDSPHSLLYHAHGGGITGRLVHDDWGMERVDGYRARDPDHPQMEPHHSVYRQGIGLERHVAHPAYPTGSMPLNLTRHLNGGSSHGNQIGAKSSGKGHCFRGCRGRSGR